MTRDDIVALLERHRDAFKRHDAEALAADFAETARLKARPTAWSRAGRRSRNLQLLVHCVSGPANHLG